MIHEITTPSDPSRAPEEPRPTADALAKAITIAERALRLDGDYSANAILRAMNDLRWLASRLPALLDADEDRQRMERERDEAKRDAAIWREHFRSLSEQHEKLREWLIANADAAVLPLPDAARSSSPTTAGRE